MNSLHHDVAMAGLYSLIEILPAETFAKETKASVSFDIYHRLIALLKAYDAHVGIRVTRWEPSENDEPDRANPRCDG